MRPPRKKSEDAFDRLNRVKQKKVIARDGEGKVIGFRIGEKDAKRLARICEHFDLNLSSGVRKALELADERMTQT